MSSLVVHRYRSFMIGLDKCGSLSKPIINGFFCLASFDNLGLQIGILKFLDKVLQ